MHLDSKVRKGNTGCLFVNRQPGDKDRTWAPGFQDPSRDSQQRDFAQRLQNRTHLFFFFLARCVVKQGLRSDPVNGLPHISPFKKSPISSGSPT